MTTEIDLNAARFFVFLSKDETEYDRYSNRDLFPIVNGLVRGKYLVRENGNVVVILSPEVKNAGSMFQVCNYVSAAILSIAGARSKIRESLKILNAPDKPTDNKTKMFVHWGGDGWRDRESSARLELQDFEAYSNWTVCALSTERPELWNIRPTPIPLPLTYEDFEKLTRLSVLSLEAQNIMWEYIRTWTLCEQRPVKINKANFLFLRDSLVGVLKRLERKVYKSDVWKINAIKDVLRRIDNNNKKEGESCLPYNGDTVVLFTELIKDYT